MVRRLKDGVLFSSKGGRAAWLIKVYKVHLLMRAVLERGEVIVLRHH